MWIRTFNMLKRLLRIRRAARLVSYLGSIWSNFTWKPDWPRYALQTGTYKAESSSVSEEQRQLIDTKLIALQQTSYLQPALEGRSPAHTERRDEGEGQLQHDTWNQSVWVSINADKSQLRRGGSDSAYIVRWPRADWLMFAFFWKWIANNS